MVATLDPNKQAELNQQIESDAVIAAATLAMMQQRLVGQRHAAEALIIGLMIRGHVLVEGLPGLAKTTAVKALAEVSDLHVKRVQFTPDLLPADIVGTQIYDPKTGEFRIKRGPIFTNLLIADEINRAPAKVQSALLEAMQERQVTLGDETFRLDDPFLVMATQNPIEQEGTYPLPEAQLDRFVFKIKVHYTSLEDEEEIVRRMAPGHELTPLGKTLKSDDMKRLRSHVDMVHVADKLRRYLVSLVVATREPSRFKAGELSRLISVGASPRASIFLERAARARAVLSGRSYVTPQDVKDSALDVLRHRIVRSYEAEADNISTDVMIEKLLTTVDVP